MLGAKLNLVAILSIFSILFTACMPVQPIETATPGSLLILTQPPTPTETPVPTDTPPPAPIDTSITKPMAVESSLGSVIYDDTNNILSIDLNTGEAKILISREELRFLLPEDKSAYSTTYGYDKPVVIDLSPDLTKALITTCSSLDDRFRCVFEYFTYILETKSLARIQTPTDIHGVHWKWSPDGTKLAGAAWTYSGTEYDITRYYSVNSDGTGIKTLVPAENGHWKSEWHPGNAVILPLTLVSDFRSVFTDVPQEVNIFVKGLRRNDKIECLSFSPDTNKVAFIIRREKSQSQDLLYIARGDFVDLFLTSQYDIDLRYTCNIDWSPDQNFIHVGYAYDPSQGDEGAQENDILLPFSMIQPATGSLLDVPNNIHLCNWAAGGTFIYETTGLAEGENKIDIYNLTGLNPSSLPENVQTMLRHCPLRWLEEDLALDIPAGLMVPNACHAGETRPDDEDPVFPSIPLNFDLREVSSSLNGEDLSAVLKLNSVSDDLTQYLTPGVTDFMNGWDVLVDIDNNITTGDRFGSEYRLSIVISPGNNGTPPALGSAILKYDPVSKTYSKSGSLQISLNSESETLTLTGSIPGISQMTRLVYLSRIFDTATNSVIGDRICN